MSPYIRIVADGETIQDGPMEVLDDLQSLQIFPVEMLDLLRPSDPDDCARHEMLGAAMVASLMKGLEGDRTLIFNVTTDASGWTLNVETMRPSFD